MKQKTYLRYVEIDRPKWSEENMEIFEGDIKKDKAYWKKHHNATVVRYFELKEVGE